MEGGKLTDYSKVIDYYIAEKAYKAKCDSDVGWYGGREGVHSKHFDACGPSSRALARRNKPLH